ncbi:hypothetical protein SAMN05444392_105107 [Seinonella peptonophila]|uniref:PDZ domain-containing protein n=2 Tax=Seinonella peptonophila TaxID=112248 RepID=A0A1M4XPB8_9BACL|nr:hypothetical protein SAMN05444392_105107 [Seinonella peptonophila]
MIMLHLNWTTFFAQPWWVLSFCYPLIHITLLNFRERNRWGSSLHPPIPYLLRTYCLGIFVGAVLSGLFSLFSVTFPFTLYEFYLVWLFTLIFSIAGMRFACFSYAVTCCGFLHLLIKLIPFVPDLSTFYYQWWKCLQQFPLRNWLWLVALLHLCEAFLVRIDGSSGKQIIEQKHLNQQIVNGFYFSQVWPIPLLLPTPMGLFPCPFLLSFSDLNLSRTIRRHQRQSGTIYFLYATGLVCLLILSSFYPIITYAALFFTLIGHEGLYQWRCYQERKMTPLFISNQKGLRVLDVFPHSPADDMGIRNGDILFRLNGETVRTIDDVTTITQKAAYCKLEVLDEELDHHNLQRPLFENDPYHLGMIGAIADQSEEDEQKEQSI